MKQPIHLLDAYQRLLSELCSQLGAERAELLLQIDPHAPPCATASYGVVNADQPADPQLEIPLCEGHTEVGWLRMWFGPHTPLPGPAEHDLARALVELAALLVEKHHVLVSEPLRQASRRMLAVSEEELQRLVLDIHDGPVQKLFVASSQLTLLQSRLDASPDDLRRDLRPVVNQLTTLVQSALHEIRNTLSTFRPAEFQRRSLPAVLQGLALQHEALTGNRVDLWIAGELPTVSLAVKIAIYRALQEALSNGYRHAGVDLHEVWLTHSNGWIEMEVVDHGRGFTPPQLDGPNATERQEHIGLRGMRERIHLVGGQLRVISQVGQGPRVIVKVPADEHTH